MGSSKQFLEQVRGFNQRMGALHSELESERSKHGRWMDVAFVAFLVGLGTAGLAFGAIAIGWNWIGPFVFVVLVACGVTVWGAIAFGLAKYVARLVQRGAR